MLRFVKSQQKALAEQREALRVEALRMKEVERKEALRMKDMAKRNKNLGKGKGTERRKAQASSEDEDKDNEAKNAEQLLKVRCSGLAVANCFYLLITRETEPRQAVHYESDGERDHCFTVPHSAD